MDRFGDAPLINGVHWGSKVFVAAIDLAINNKDEANRII